MQYILKILVCFATGYAVSAAAMDTRSGYPSNQQIQCENYIPTGDPGRDRDENLFGKIYGRTAEEVKNHLAIVYWMPFFFGHQYPLHITTINGVDLKVHALSKKLENLVQQHPEYLVYLDHPSGAFYWRHIQNSSRRSPHSYGIAIDLNTNYANYWIWDTGIKQNKLNQIDHFEYKNYIPCAIVSVFENEGFIWGGKWIHYDTMHFEYRPEMFHDK